MHKFGFWLQAQAKMLISCKPRAARETQKKKSNNKNNEKKEKKMQLESSNNNNNPNYAPALWSSVKCSKWSWPKKKLQKTIQKHLKLDKFLTYFAYPNQDPRY